MNNELRHKLVEAIDNGVAILVPEAGIARGEEDEFLVRFYRFDGEIYMTTYNKSDTVTTMNELRPSDRDLFNAHYTESTTQDLKL